VALDRTHSDDTQSNITRQDWNPKDKKEEGDQQLPGDKPFAELKTCIITWAEAKRAATNRPKWTDSCCGCPLPHTGIA